MPKKEIFLTSEGFLNLENELNTLKFERRPKVLDLLKEARALGDLSENSEYDAALNEQESVENRIKEIEYTLEHATIIEEAKGDKVGIGSTVVLQYDGEEDEEEYKIVGSQEADPFNNKISNESPIATAILNKKVGSTVEVASPDGVYKVKIVSIA
ncbi:MAG: transcription elongation factor GreA [Bacilli bacterium]|nr:transcription elongation factor GreA [Bacilli bacterium]